MKLRKGNFYKVVKQGWMKNEIAEYHSSFLSVDNETILHNMIFRDVEEKLDIGLFEPHEIYEELADGIIL